MEECEEPAAPEAAAPPEVSGYDVGRLLGRGSSAAVWLATDRTTRRNVALKCFTAGARAADPPLSGAAEAVRREVRILSALDHEHLVKAHAVVRARCGAGDAVALVLDYAPGGSLAGLVAARGRLGPAETVTVLTPIAQVLGYLHGEGFTHGDVAPGNVLFTAQGKPLLADLGVGRMLADPQDRVRPGTEGFRDPGPVDAVRAGLQPEADVYSVAALGWFCLTGRIPEPEPNRPPLPLLVPGVPPGLVEALESGLRLDRRQRPSALELAAAIFRSTPAVPVDLSASVDPAVLPQLLTRRPLPATARERRSARVRAWRDRLAFPGSRLRSGQAVSTRRAGPDPASRAVAGARHATGRRASGRGRHRRGWRRAVALMVLAVLTTTGLLAAPLVFGPAGGPAAGPKPGPGSAPTSGAPIPSAPTSGAPTSGAPIPGAPTSGAASSSPAASTSALPADLEALLASPRPEEAVRGLAALRSYALASGNLGLLERVTVPASPAAASDAALAARLARSGHVLDGFQERLLRVERRPESTAERAVVLLDVASPPYRERDAAGTVVAEAAAAGEQRLRLVLVPVGGSWRIQQILAGAEDGG